MLLYHNNNHFDLFYDINEEIIEKNNNKKSNFLNIEKEINISNVKFNGVNFKNLYVEYKFNNTTYLYDEIAGFLKSIKNNEDKNNKLKKSIQIEIFIII